ncbi:MAG: PKD domain-containing protein, partial [Bacteroidia bacterium]|nr:PKD domain-containing protein [Bacteroidia bacterium]
MVRQAQADFSYSSNGTCYPVTVVFTDLSTNAVSWYWNFGDGYSSTLQNPTHVFHYPPSGPITLTITDNNGCTKTISKPNITGVNISVTVSDTIGCSPFSTSFSGSAQGALSWLWDFGDGNTSTLQNPVHTYTSVGVYNVTLTVSMNNCTATILLPEKIYVIKPMPDFNSPTVAVCAPSLVQFNDLSTGAVQWHWDFGDGTSATVQNPSHIYNIPGYYTVSLTIWDSLGCSATKINTDYIYVPGTYTYFSLIANNNCLNTFVQFSDSSVGATSWLWNFGDGYISTLQNPTHTYLDTGSYTVSLISTDSIGCTSYYTYPDPIVVHPSPVAQGQLITPASKCVPLTVSLINQSTLYTSVVWHFGNGDSSIATNPVYTYQNPGTFNVYLIAYNQFGCQDTFQVAVIDAEKVPDAGFTATPASGCSPLSVQLTN